MTEKRFRHLLAKSHSIGLTTIEANELEAAITFTPEPLKYFQKRVEVPEPCRKALEYEQEYFVPKLNKGNPTFIKLTWRDDQADLDFLAADLIYLTPEHATARAAAWLEVEVGDE